MFDGTYSYTLDNGSCGRAGADLGSVINEGLIILQVSKRLLVLEEKNYNVVQPLLNRHQCF